MVEVVAALIWEKDRFMICQRPTNKARGNLWEFVGGKVEPGEKKEDALVRECQEELNLTILVGEEFTDVIYKYPDITIHMTVFCCTISKGSPKLLEHKDLRWIKPNEIYQFEFCPADVEVLEKIESKYGSK